MTLPPRAVIWDVDGTLVDTAELHFAAWVAFARQRGWEFTRSHFQSTFGRRNPEIVRQLFSSNASDDEVLEIGEQKERIYRQEVVRQGVELLPGVKNLLAQFREHGVRQAIGSSAPRANLAMILDMTDTAGFFDAVVSMEDTQRGKPDPEVFVKAAEKLGIAPGDSVVFEDAVAGVQAAKAAGMRCVAVRFVGHHSEESLRAAGANWVVDSLEEFDPSWF